MSRQAQPGSEADRLLRALNHELRRQILQKMGSEELFSPKSLSKRLAAPLSNVSYHVRELADLGAIVLVGTKPTRGSVEHFYRLSIEADWAREVLGLPAKSGRQEPDDNGY